MEFIRKIVGKEVENGQTHRIRQEASHREWMERRKKGVERLAILDKNREELLPSRILDELEEIHTKYEIPNFPPLHPDHANLWFYRIAEIVADSPQLSEQDTRRMVSMYEWDEVRIQGVGGVNFSILRAAERFPHPEIYEGLEAHLENAEKWRDEEGPGSHRYASLAEEVNRLKKLLPKCQ